MTRGKTGRYETTSAGGEEVRAFIPAPLPPDPAIAIDQGLQLLLEQAALSLGRLDSLSTLLPDTGLFLYMYIRKEAVLSSQIEGTQSSLSDLLLFELKEAPGAPVEDVVEVSNYVAALTHGLARIAEGFPLCNRLIREIHAELLASGRGSDKDPGHFRRSQNWIGGSRPGNAAFVPPPPQAVPDCMAEFERFLHSPEEAFPLLLQAGLAHVQFETIHPFLDGNGRIGRLLITLMLCNAGALREPMLYLSLYLKQHRGDYYGLLDKVRSDGDWEEWLEFFLIGVRQTADAAVSAAREVRAMFEADRDQIQAQGRSAGSALRVHQVLKERPIVTLSEVSRDSGLSFPGTSTAMEVLTGLGIARELTGKKRGRVYGYDQYLAVLSEGTEPL